MSSVFIIIFGIFVITISPAYSEVNSISDNLDEEPESLDYFIEKGFTIATLHDKYGNYLIPYKSDSKLISIEIGKYEGEVLINQENSTYVEIIIPQFLVPRLGNNPNNEQSILLFDNEEEEFKLKKTIMGNSLLFKFEIYKDVQKIEIINAVANYGIASDIVRPHNQKTTNTIFFNIFSPLKQIQNSVPHTDILCKNKLHLVFQQDNFPACVKKDSIMKLTERNWIK